MSSLKSNYVFQLTGTLLTSGTTVTISNDLELNATVAFTDARIVLRNRNATIIERCVGTAAAGTLTLSKRGLEQGDVEVENAGLKKERREGTIVYVTILASQLVDRQENNTFAGTQTFNNLIVDNQFTGPVFADDTARDTAIPSPTNGMIVQTGGIYQGYNAGTAQWEDFDIGTPPPDASETVKGLVQEATQAELNAATAVGSTGARLFTNPSKLPAAVADYITNNSTVQNALTQEVTTLVSAGLAESIVDRDTYFLGEDADAGDSVFVEDMVTFASADQVQAIGDTADNTRVSIPAFGSGVSSDELKLSLRKYVSPGVDLGVRIETDNAGEPSGTLFDADAIATVTEASLTTSLVDTTVTLADNITIPLGEKVWIVLNAVGDVVNGTNYFGVGYSDIDTTTRPMSIFDGTNWSSLADEDLSIKTDGVTQTTNPGGSVISRECTITITPKYDIIVSSQTSGWTGISIGSILRKGVAYEAKKTVTSSPRNFTILPDENVNISVSNFGDHGNYEIQTFILVHMPYVSSDLFAPKLLSLTDATYSYKIPTDLHRVLTESKTAGQYAIATTLGLNNNFSGLTPNVIMYYSNTPGLLSSSPGTNIAAAGVSIDIGKLFVGAIYSYNISSGTVYRAYSNGMVTAYRASINTAYSITGYTDSSTNPTTVVAQDGNNGVSGGSSAANISFFVKKGDYYKVEGTISLGRFNSLD